MRRTKDEADTADFQPADAPRATAPAAAEPQRPSGGGSFVRLPDGKLERRKEA